MDNLIPKSEHQCAVAKECNLQVARVCCYYVLFKRCLSSRNSHKHEDEKIEEQE